MTDERGRANTGCRDAVIYLGLSVAIWLMGIFAFGVAVAIGEAADYPTGIMVPVDWISRGLAYVLGFPSLYLLEIPGVRNAVQPRFRNAPVEFVAFAFNALLWAGLGVGVLRYLRRRRRTTRRKALASPRRD